MDKRIGLLFAAGAQGQAMLRDMFDDSGVGEIELLDFLMEEQVNMDGIDIVEIVVLSALSSGHESVQMFIPTECVHFRDLEYRGKGRKTSLLRNRTARRT